MLDAPEERRRQRRAARQRYGRLEHEVFPLPPPRADGGHVAGEAVDHIDELVQFSFGGNAADKMQDLIAKLDLLENKNNQTEVTLRAELFAIEKDLPPVNVIFLYDIINKIGELSDRSQQVGHRISLIASR